MDLELNIFNLKKRSFTPLFLCHMITIKNPTNVKIMFVGQYIPLDYLKNKFN